jgi:putative phage-type endonuclease
VLIVITLELGTEIGMEEKLLKGTRIDLEQGTESWIQWRKTGIGGSESGSVMGVNPYCDAYELWQRKLGLLPEVEVNDAMQRGHDLEPIARQIFEIETGIKMPAACYEQLGTYSFLHASLDGISIDERLILEIKCPGLKTHSEALSGKLKPYYYSQIQHNLVTTGAELCYYFSYTDVDDVEPWKIIEVRRDEEYIQRLLEREQKFWQHIIDEIPPDEYFGCKDAGNLNSEIRTDPAFIAALQELMSSKKVLDDAKAQYKLRANRVEDLMSKKKQVVAITDGLRIERIYNQEKQQWRLEISSEGD